jgi:hypothetical protein
VHQKFGDGRDQEASSLQRKRHYAGSETMPDRRCPSFIVGEVVSMPQDLVQDLNEITRAGVVGLHGAGVITLHGAGVVILHGGGRRLP